MKPVATIIIPILQIRTLKPKKVTELAESHETHSAGGVFQ